MSKKKDDETRLEVVKAPEWGASVEAPRVGDIVHYVVPQDLQESYGAGPLPALVVSVQDDNISAWIFPAKPGAQILIRMMVPSREWQWPDDSKASS